MIDEDLVLLPSVTPLATFPKLPLLLIDTREPRSTASQVDKVKTLRHNMPSMTDILLGGIGQLTTSAMKLIQS